MHAEGRAMVKRINMRRPNHKTSAAYTAHRFPDTTVEQLRLRIAEFRPLMGLHNQIEAIETSPNIFEIRAVASSEAT